MNNAFIIFNFSFNNTSMNFNNFIILAKLIENLSRSYYIVVAECNSFRSFEVCS